MKPINCLKWKLHGRNFRISSPRNDCHENVAGHSEQGYSSCMRAYTLARPQPRDGQPHVRPLHQGVNFINILLAAFLYESVLHSFSLITIWLCKFFGAKILVQKLLIKCWWNWQKDNVIVMSATQRFRRKCVTTILYRPIWSCLRQQQHYQQQQKHLCWLT